MNVSACLVTRGETACSIEGCGRRPYSKSFCEPHYRRFRRHGDPMAGRIIGDDDRRFWSKVDRRGADECWPFTGKPNCNGYGILNYGGKRILAHRISSIMVDGPIPNGICVLHHCDNPPCCNPAHLFRGTRVDNNADMRAKGRGSNPPRNDVRGSRNGHAKLTEEDIPRVRRARRDGASVGALASAYGVSHSLISMILGGKRWAHA